MSAFTDRLYASWLGVNGRARRSPGYGAQPHGSEAKRPEGYPSGLLSPAKAHPSPHNPGSQHATDARTWAQPSRPAAAHSRPEKPVLDVRVSALPSINSPGADYVDNSHPSFLFVNEDYSVENHTK